MTTLGDDMGEIEVEQQITNVLDGFGESFQKLNADLMVQEIMNKVVAPLLAAPIIERQARAEVAEGIAAAIEAAAEKALDDLHPYEHPDMDAVNALQRAAAETESSERREVEARARVNARFAELEAKLAEAQRDRDVQKEFAKVCADGMKRRQAELELVRPVVEAAKAWREAGPDDYIKLHSATEALYDAVDALAAADSSSQASAADTGETGPDVEASSVRCEQCGQPIEWRDDIDWWVHVDAHMPPNQHRRAPLTDVCTYCGGTWPCAAHIAWGNDGLHRRAVVFPNEDKPDTSQNEDHRSGIPTANLAVTSRGLAMHAVLSEVIEERFRQDARWGESNHPDGTDDGEFFRIRRDWRRQATKEFAQAGQVTWRHILDEEVHKVFAEVDPVVLREKLINSAAVAVAWAEAIDRRADSRAGQTGEEAAHA